jgi:hypothetical protein
MTRVLARSEADYLQACFDLMMGDLTYPVARDGGVMDATPIKPWVCWHLIRCGWRKPNNLDGLALVEEYDDPQIKPRKVYGPGVVEDAITWVPLGDPDDPLEHLADMTMAEINRLPPDVCLEAKRRLGMLPPAPERGDPEPAWSVRPYIKITDEPDVDDGTAWTKGT